ncbi:hypothetical protein GCM10022225_07790 [Plantactinospora mayteni]|uniref:Uncharacterized protein n=1 Tax=Plantactinospora mayteni TaxID=566021 RepID=A0ABQ4EIM8_9ACTN|nr:hypothetical protein Pma05_10480 [Plantactinospora mayteni]
MEQFVIRHASTPEQRFLTTVGSSLSKAPQAAPRTAPGTAGACPALVVAGPGDELRNDNIAVPSPRHQRAGTVTGRVPADRAPEPQAANIGTDN